MKALSSELIRFLYNGSGITITDIFDFFKKEQQKDIIRIARTLSAEGRMQMERGKQADSFL
jgi:hypothetical protein